MLDQFSREEMLIGKNNIIKLNNSKVAIFGIGGVGGFVAEGLVRAGIGKFILVDNDVVSITNLNRQIIATHKTIGKAKVDLMKDRILEINPNAEVTTFKEFYLPNTDSNIKIDDIDYLVDCIDTVSGKIGLIELCKSKNIPIISALGTGNKLDPTKLKVSDIYKTDICPLAKVIRKELRKREIDSLKVVYSDEIPIKPTIIEEETVPGSISFVPSVAGLIIAGEVIKDIIK